MIEKAQLTKPPEVLADKARELIQRLGYTAPPGDSAYAFDYNDDFLNAVEKTDRPLPQWDEIARSRPSPLKFWYRQSPEAMLAFGLHDEMFIPGDIQEDDPKPTMSGMIDVQLDPQGRLDLLRGASAGEGRSAAANSAAGLERSFRRGRFGHVQIPTGHVRCGRRWRLPMCAKRGPASGPDTITGRCMWKPPPGMAARSIFR